MVVVEGTSKSRKLLELNIRLWEAQNLLPSGKLKRILPRDASRLGDLLAWLGGIANLTIMASSFILER